MKIPRTELLFRNNFIAIEYDNDDDWMYVNWRGIVSQHDVVAGCGEILRFVKERQITAILNDNTHVEGAWSGASKWVGTEWFPAIQESGVKHFAWIYSPSVLSRLSADKALKFVSNKTLIRFFDEYDLAADWLRTSR
ncbi:hypothetical protein [Pontibacter liquoris]|uniref:hypothetical protein n=1 Tax=Pontibacter liquoris TaxID=2905677 RepID=UPI001FA7CEF9|nr:hypothetical protein [Pontibacter liquoris]